MPPMMVSEAARKAGVSRRTLLRKLDCGELRGYKVPGTTTPWLIQPDDLDQWIAEQNKAAS